jgi:phosphohistidine phosphatase SixA
VSPSNRRSSSTELYLLRHAHAGDPEGWTGDDAARPLSAKGEGQADRLGAFLAGVGFRPDAIASSPKIRARQTAEIVAGHLGVEVRLEERLAGAFEATAVDAILADLGGPVRPMLVGHDPDFSELLSWLARAEGLTMKKGAFARVDVQGPVASGQGSLRWLVPPDLLEGRRS